MKRSIPFFSALILLLALASELFAQQWGTTGTLGTARSRHTITLLNNGTVLVVGGNIGGAAITASAEIFDPATGNWVPTGSLNTARADHIAVKLSNGKVLVVGGITTNPTASLSSAELYDPQTRTWSAVSGMSTPRQAPVAVRLQNGKVLVAAGFIQPGATFIRSAEVYDPITNQWSSAGTLNGDHGNAQNSTLTLLPNGKALIAGGLDQIGPSNKSEVYDPATNSWTQTGDMRSTRYAHAANLLPNGKVLVSGGRNQTFLAESELYDPATGQWSASGNIGTLRALHTSTLLPNGKVLIAVGQVGATAQIKSAELYDPNTGAWAPTADLNQARDNTTATLLPNGKVLIAGGGFFPGSGLITPLSSTELYDSGAPVAATVSGASYLFQIAPKEIVAAFGQNFSTLTISAVNVLATTSMAGVTVKIKDVLGVERLAPLFFVSPQQINYQIPAGTASGQAVVTVTASDGRQHNGLIQVDAVAPAFFTVNQQGTGAAAALDGIRLVGAPFDATQPNGEPSYLAFFGTGLGADVTDVNGDVKANVEARIDGQPVTVVYAGQAPFYVGLNQINIQLPIGISSGTHTFTLSRNGAVSPPVTFAIK